jgi:hypothetical protein
MIVHSFPVGRPRYKNASDILRLAKCLHAHERIGSFRIASPPFDDPDGNARLRIEFDNDDDAKVVYVILKMGGPQKASSTSRCT